MAATVRSDGYSGLVRKIGYSVGLEYLGKRVADLADVYVGKGSIDGADWRDLVAGWRRSAAERHIADVYAQLELIRRLHNTIQVLPALDAISIILSGDSSKLNSDCAAEAIPFILLFKILEADGDIFLNALAVRFRAPELKSALQDMIRLKRRKVAPLFKQAGSIRRIAEAISIKNQTDATSQGKRQTYAERSRQLRGTETHHKDAVNWTDETIAISDDYLEKACVTRRAWAEDVGLFDRSADRLTIRGEALMSALDDLGLGQDIDAQRRYAFWPYGFAMRAIGIAPAEIGVRDITSFDLLRAIGSTWSPPVHTSAVPLSRDDIIGMLTQIMECYRNVSRRGSIRHDLPLFIAEPVFVFWCMCAGREIIDFRAFIREELQRADRKLDYVLIRGTEGGLRLMGAN